MPKKILVVDDEPKIAEICQDYLKAAGFDVTTASKGPDGLSAARKGCSRSRRKMKKSVRAAPSCSTRKAEASALKTCREAGCGWSQPSRRQGPGGAEPSARQGQAEGTV